MLPSLALQVPRVACCLLGILCRIADDVARQACSGWEGQASCCTPRTTEGVLSLHGRRIICEPWRP